MSVSLYEQFRIERLHRLGLLDTPPDERFDRLTALASDIYGTSIALVSLIDADRQWFKSKQGVAISETPRFVSFCSQAITEDDVFVVPDASRDARFAKNPLVLGEPCIRFYAGVPVREPTGFKVGTLCVIDSKVRSIDDMSFKPLVSLAKMVEEEIAEHFYADRSKSCKDSPSRILQLLNKSQSVAPEITGDSGGFAHFLTQALDITRSRIGAILAVATDQEDSRGENISTLASHGMDPDCLQRLVQCFAENAHSSVGSMPETIQKRHLPNQVFIPVIGMGRLLGLLFLAESRVPYQANLNDEIQPLVLAIGMRMERLELQRSWSPTTLSSNKLSQTDLVTELHNREFFQDVLNKTFEQHCPSNEPFSVLYIDLDNLAEINDRYGRTSANEVLRVIAKRLKRFVRSSSKLARVAGDEFAIIIDGACGEVFLERVLGAIRSPIKLLSTSVSMTASVGVVSFPGHGGTADSLLRHATQAMLDAKASGKNCYREFDAKSHQDSIERTRMIEQAKSGFKTGEFELLFQPKVYLAERRVAGFEALIRWHHPSLGFLTPDKFLANFVGNECDVLLGQFVIERAIEVLRDFERRSLSFSISVNLSPSHFLSADFIDFLDRATEDCSETLLQRLTLEILETTAVDDFETVVERVETCRNMGMRVSLDDFGTGYSSLSYFRQLPLDEIKIDRSFVNDLLSVHLDAFIIETMINLATEFDREVVAEGIECQAIADKLVSVGCKIGQGYHFSRPLPLAEAIDWASTFSREAPQAQSQGDSPPRPDCALSGCAW